MPKDLPPDGIRRDFDVEAALHWFAQVSGNSGEFWRRIDIAQERYRTFTQESKSLGRGPELAELGSDIVASFLAQAKSLLDSRRTYDVALASRCIPWVKQC